MVRVVTPSIGPKGRVVGVGLLLLGVPGGKTLRNGVGVTDIVELGDAEAVLQSQTTYMDGLVAHDALHEVLGVAGLVALAAEMRGTAEVREVAEVLLAAILHVLDAIHVIETTARLHQTLENHVRVVGQRVLLLLPAGGEVGAIGVVVVVACLMLHLATLRTDLLHLHVGAFFDLAFVNEFLVVVRVVSLLLAQRADHVSRFLRSGGSIAHSTRTSPTFRTLRMETAATRTRAADQVIIAVALAAHLVVQIRLAINAEFRIVRRVRIVGNHGLRHMLPFAAGSLDFLEHVLRLRTVLLAELLGHDGHLL